MPHEPAGRPQTPAVPDGPTYRLHSLRHSAIVAILDGTVGDLRAAQAVAGHQNIQTTVSVYGKDADEARKRAAAAMDEVLAKVQKSS